MGKLSLREAVKAFDVSRPTLLKALKTGKVSGVKDGKGRWEIDPSELSRVYLARQQEDGGEDSVSHHIGKEFSRDSRALEAELKESIRALEADLSVERINRQAAENLAEERKRHLEDLRRLLPSPSQAAASHVWKKPGWWPW